MNESNRLKVWLVIELAIALLFYYMSYNIILVMLGKLEPWFQTSLEYQTFVATIMFLYGTYRLINFFLSLIKKEINAIFTYFTGDWFSVHKLFRRNKDDRK